MNRTPIVLSLLGVVLFLLGLYLMLRVAMPTPFAVTMNDQYGFEEARRLNMDTLRQNAAPGVFGTYVAVTASGLAIFLSGLTMMFGRARLC